MTTGPALPSQLRRLAPALAALAVGLGVTINAWGGLMPGVGFWDTGEVQTVLPILGTAHPTGYPTYILLGFVANLILTPIGEPAFRINALSLLAVATAAGLTVELVRRLTGSLALGVAAGIGLATTPVGWTHATSADPHPIHLAFVALLLLILVGWERAHRAEREGSASPASSATRPKRWLRPADRWLVAAAIVFGLSVGNHSLTLLLAPPVALYVVAVEPGIVRRPRLIATCAAALAVTLVAVYLELPLRAGPFRAPLVYAQPDTWSGFWYIALAEQFRGSLSDPLGDLPRKLGDLWTLTWNQLGIVAVLVPIGFLATVRRAPRYALLTGTAMVITVGFDASYANADISRYYLGPVLWAWTWVACLAAEAVALVVALWALLERRAREELRPAAIAVTLALALVLLVPTANALGARGQAADRHGDTLAAAWLDSVLPAVAPNAVLISWWSTSTPLWYAELVQGRRTDIDVVDDRTILDRGYGTANGAIGHFLGQRPVYIIRANANDLAGVAAVYQLRRVVGSGSLAVYQVLGPAGGG